MRVGVGVGGIGVDVSVGGSGVGVGVGGIGVSVAVGGAGDEVAVGTTATAVAVAGGGVAVAGAPQAPQTSAISTRNRLHGPGILSLIALLLMVKIAFIQSVYCASVLTSSSGSA
jgi:hypothetical protein